MSSRKETFTQCFCWGGKPKYAFFTRILFVKAYAIELQQKQNLLYLIPPPECGCVGAAVGAGQHRAALPAGALGPRAVSHHGAAAAVHLVIQAAGVT